MEYRQVGATDLKVSVVAAGAWATGGTHWGNASDPGAVAALRRSIDRGVNLIDTAPVYGKGHSEELVGTAIEGRRSEVLISTKCGLLIDQGNRHCLTPASMRAEAEASLKRLRTDVIDMYFCHWPDPSTPIEETVGGLVALQRAGTIRHFGLSNHAPDLIRRAVAAGPLACLQEHYSLLERRVEKDILPLAREHGLGLFAYGPLGGGILTGKYREKPAFATRDVRDFFYPYYKEPGWSRVQDLIDELRRIAGTRAVPPSQAAIAWVNRQPGVTCSLVGARSGEQAEANAGAGDLTLTDEELRDLSAASERVCAAL